jgi:hypothetical protein
MWQTFLMRTTINIKAPLYQRLKARAARSPKRIKLPLIASKRPGTVRLDNARIYDIISFP